MIEWHATSDRTEASPRIDIGHGVTVELRRIDGELDGVTYWHSCDGVIREDSIPVKPAWRDGWTVVSLEPLTLAPSLLCTLCGFHGFIRDGRWVSA